MSDPNLHDLTPVTDATSEEAVEYFVWSGESFLIGTNITFHFAALWTCLMYIRNRVSTRAYFAGTSAVAAIRVCEVVLGAHAVTHLHSSVAMAMAKSFLSAISHSTLLLIHVHRVQALAHGSPGQDAIFRKLFLVFAVLVFLSVITLLWSVADTILPLSSQTHVTSFNVTLGNIVSSFLANLTHVILILYAMSIQYQETLSPLLLIKPALLWWNAVVFALSCIGNVVVVGLCAMDPVFDPQWGLPNLTIGLQTHAFTSLLEHYAKKPKAQSSVSKSDSSLDPPSGKRAAVKAGSHNSS